MRNERSPAGSVFRLNCSGRGQGALLVTFHIVRLCEKVFWILILIPTLPPLSASLTSKILRAWRWACQYRHAEKTLVRRGLSALSGHLLALSPSVNSYLISHLTSVGIKLSELKPTAFLIPTLL